MPAGPRISIESTPISQSIVWSWCSHGHCLFQVRPFKCIATERLTNIRSGALVANPIVIDNQELAETTKHVINNLFKDLQLVPGSSFWAISIYVHHLRLQECKIGSLFKGRPLVLVSGLCFWATLICVHCLHHLKITLIFSASFCVIYWQLLGYQK